jgi:hypothetical protein
MIILSTHVTMTPNRGMKNFYNTKVDGVKVFRYSDETAEAVASGEKLLKESGTIYESFADMMSPEDAKRYLDFLENGKKTIRWYDSEGKAYRDVDMSDHGNSKEHLEVPHEHTWEYNNGKPKRN